MSFLGIYLLTFLVLMTFLSLLWLVSVLAKNASIIDLAWGLLFALAALTHFALTPDGWPVRKILITAMYTLWGLRLSIYLTWRNLLKHTGEDYRYTRMRERIGPSFWWKSWFTVFLMQGVIAGLISVVSLAAQFNPGPAYLTLFDIAGVLIWAMGFFFETVGDLQLARFKANPANKGKVLNTGLWGLTRHPNYFGNASMWWGYFLVALSVPFGFLTIYGPAFMTFLLVRVSGVAMLEKDQAAKKPGYADYIRTVPAFIPRLPGTVNRTK
jgi:steroid 5-alpha reductase family enzyme